MSSVTASMSTPDGLERWLRTVDALSEGRESAAGATPEQVGDVEGRLGVRLDETHRRLLLARDGWEPTGRTAALAGAVRIASAAWLVKAPRTFSGPALEPIIGDGTARELRDAGISPPEYLAVAVDGFFGATYLTPVRDGRVGPEVVTLAGWVEEDTFVGQIYPSFSDFLGAMAEQVAGNAERVVAREAKEAHARQVWHAEPAVVIRGLPESLSQLASGVTTLMEALTGPHPGASWTIATRRWDGSPEDFVRVLNEASRVLPDCSQTLFLTASIRVEGGAHWQVSITRSWPAAPADHVLILLRSAGDGAQPTPADVEVLVARAAEIFSPTSITASSTAAHRAATELGMPQPTGYRVWLRGDQLGSAAGDVDGGEIGIRPSGRGVLLSSPDSWAPEQVVAPVHSLIAGLREDRPDRGAGASVGAGAADAGVTDAGVVDERGGRLARWLRSRRR